MLACGSAWAQYTMSASDIYVLGEARIYNGVDTTGIVEGMGGTGLTWDYSGATITSLTRTAVVSDPANHPESATYPSSTHVLDFSNGEYRFFTIDNDSVVFDGEVSLLNTPIDYSVKPTIFKFPLNQNDIQQDSLYSYYNTGSLGFAFRFGNYNTLFDGSGTLILPNGLTYANCNRILTFVDVRDSSQAFPAFTDIQIARYEWFVEGVSLPVMISETRIVSANGGAPTETKEIFILDSNVVSIEQPFDFGVQLFPNPASDQVRVVYDMNADEQVEVEILNAVGQRVAIKNEGLLNAGRHETRFETTELPRGVYLIRIAVGEAAQVEKLILK